MVELGGDAGLVQEAESNDLVVGQAAFQFLDSHVAIQSRVASPPDITHPARAAAVEVMVAAGVRDPGGRGSGQRGYVLDRRPSAHQVRQMLAILR